jgi:hypothetical protein
LLTHSSDDPSHNLLISTIHSHNLLRLSSKAMFTTTSSLGSRSYFPLLLDCCKFPTAKEDSAFLQRMMAGEMNDPRHCCTSIIRHPPSHPLLHLRSINIRLLRPSAAPSPVPSYSLVLGDCQNEFDAVFTGRTHHFSMYLILTRGYWNSKRLLPGPSRY